MKTKISPENLFSYNLLPVDRSENIFGNIMPQHNHVSSDSNVDYYIRSTGHGVATVFGSCMQ